MGRDQRQSQINGAVHASRRRNSSGERTRTEKNEAHGNDIFLTHTLCDDLYFLVKTYFPVLQKRHKQRDQECNPCAQKDNEEYTDRQERRQFPLILIFHNFFL